MYYPLTVPFSEKEQAKQAGAWWNPERKIWMIPDHIADLNKFIRWISPVDGCIVRKPYLMAVTKRHCWKCKKETPMIAPAAKNYFYLDYEDVNDPENEKQIWYKGEYPTLFSNVIYLPEPLVEALTNGQSFYKFTYSKTQKRSTWANTCISCGALQGDYHNHEEPGGAFFPHPYEDSPKPEDIKMVEFEMEFDYVIQGDFGSDAYEDIDFII